MRLRRRRTAVTAPAVVAFLACALLVPNAAEARFGARTLRPGDFSRDVKTLQRYLKRAGYRVSADGEYGRATTRAERRFERDLELRVDGIASPSDQRILRASIRGQTSGGATYVAPPSDQTVAGPKAKLTPDGFAIPPAAAPPAIKAVIAAGNRIAKTPYKWGGGHGAWKDTGYDCSGSVSYALHGGRLLSSPLVSGDFMDWGTPGRGKWITIRANGGHVYMMVAGLRFDTSARRLGGSRWTTVMRSASGFTGVHPTGY